VRALGVLVVVLGAVLAGRSVLLLAGRGRPRRGPRPPFVLAGPYLRLRNPLFAGVVLVAAGAALACSSWAGVGAAAAIAAAAHAWVVGVEEPRLQARFGPAYGAYRRSVPRWIPGRGRGADGDPA
jgi:protein-S-isoprenylcysteine O-methyltransferase Ste14